MNVFYVGFYSAAITIFHSYGTFLLLLKVLFCEGSNSACLAHQSSHTIRCVPDLPFPFLPCLMNTVYIISFYITNPPLFLYTSGCFSEADQLYASAVQNGKAPTAHTIVEEVRGLKIRILSLFV
jgi:hypothetical protein